MEYMFNISNDKQTTENFNVKYRNNTMAYMHGSH